MKMKLLVAFAAAGLSVAAAKSYDISLSQAVRVGSTQLPPGTYKLKVEASKVTLMDPNTGRTVTADAKVSTADKKYDHTAIVSRRSMEPTTSTKSTSAAPKPRSNST